MGEIKNRENGKKSRRARRSKRVMQHRLSVMAISCVIVMLAVVLMFGSISLHKKNEKYKAQEAKLQMQIAEEDERAKEIEELEAYVGTDEYVEDVAKDKLGLVYPDEIIFEAE